MIVDSVRVVYGREAAEAGLHIALGGGGVEGGIRLEVSGATETVVGFIASVEQVEGDDENLDAAAVGGIGARAQAGSRSSARTVREH